ncbi:MAG: DNA translocase FtsK, partial [Candidatus Nitrosopelagicus sp.]|nr:DNA translocase FtsK [Candidatus Nitrosopelagicus sp.]
MSEIKVRNLFPVPIFHYKLENYKETDPIEIVKSEMLKKKFATEKEIEKINKHLRSQEEPDYVDEILNFKDEKEMGENNSNNGDKDELYEAALDIIKSEGKASTSFLQRKLQIGYN